jgi:hypothetical protein
MRVIGLAVVLALSLVLAPLAAEAPQAEKSYRLGYLINGTALGSREPNLPSALNHVAQLRR